MRSILCPILANKDNAGRATSCTFFLEAVCWTTIVSVCIAARGAVPETYGLLEDTAFAQGFGASWNYGRKFTLHPRRREGKATEYRDISPWTVHLIPDGPVAKFLAKKGEGIHHIAFRVENIEAALEELKEKGVRLIDEKPRKGAGGKKIAFLHPKATNGVLVELCE